LRLTPRAGSDFRGETPEWLGWDKAMLPGRPLTDWDVLSDDSQLRLAREAMQRASDTIANHAEQLANELEAGEIADMGGPDALRLLANMVRVAGREPMFPAGSA
jgi:hypothetical protein